MKRKVLGLSFVLVLFFSVTLGLIFDSFALANPSPYLDYPTEPVMTPPIITVYSPIQNENYDSGNIWLNFTITKPEAWFKIWAHAEKGNPIYHNFGKLTSVSYNQRGTSQRFVAFY